MIYMASYMSQLFHMARNVAIASRPDIFSIDQAVIDQLSDIDTGDEEWKIDLTSKAGVKDSIGHVLGMLVAPVLTDEQMAIV